MISDSFPHRFDKDVAVLYLLALTNITIKFNYLSNLELFYCVWSQLSNPRLLQVLTTEISPEKKKKYLTVSGRKLLPESGFPPQKNNVANFKMPIKTNKREKKRKSRIFL